MLWILLYTLCPDGLTRRGICEYCLIIMACNHYEIKYKDYFLKYKNLSSISDCKFIECDINNKITLIYVIILKVKHG